MNSTDGLGLAGLGHSGIHHKATNVCKKLEMYNIYIYIYIYATSNKIFKKRGLERKSFSKERLLERTGGLFSGGTVAIFT